MSFVKPVESGDSPLWAGTVFRFPAQYPFEAWVDFLLFFDPNSESGFSMVSVTGEEAGNLQARLPKAALASGNVRAIDRAWLVENWQSAIYAYSSAVEVWVLPNYPAAENPARGKK